MVVMVDNGGPADGAMANVRVVAWEAAAAADGGMVVAPAKEAAGVAEGERAVVRRAARVEVVARVAVPTVTVVAATAVLAAVAAECMARA